MVVRQGPHPPLLLLAADPRVHRALAAARGRVPPPERGAVPEEGLTEAAERRREAGANAPPQSRRYRSALRGGNLARSSSETRSGNCLIRPSASTSANMSMCSCPSSYARI